MKKRGSKKSSNSGSSAENKADLIEWEMRPGGMLVQKREHSASDPALGSSPTIKLRVTYGSSMHEVSISLQATFGELKKLLASETGLGPQEQRLMFRGKERDSSDYLDTVGVKDKSKIVLIEDPASRERKYIEMKRNAIIERACKAIAEVRTEVDKLAGKVSALESVILSGNKVAENDLVALIEMLMRQLITLDGIAVEGDAKLQRRIQARRVQKCVEILDALKVRNAMPNPMSNHSVVMPTNWETFDSTSLPSTSSTAPGWELFD
eukprot:Gb_09360 [translate_table: standard]